MTDPEPQKPFSEFTSEFIDRTGHRLISGDPDFVYALELGAQARADALIGLLGVLEAVVGAHPDHLIPKSVIERQTRWVLTQQLASLDRQLTAHRTTSAFVDKETTSMITDTEMREQIVTALSNYAAEHDVDAIFNELRDTYGLVNIDTIDSEEFWLVVEKHQI